MRKIDADELIKTIEKVCFSPEWARFRADFGSKGERDYIINEIVNAPTIEEKTGEWGEVFHHQGYNYHKCSNCCFSVKLADYDNFCPNCGAKMKGGE